MASSGWLGEQFLVQRSSNISYYGNVYISSISRGTSSVTISGTIRLTSKGTSGYKGYYNYGVQADPSGTGGWVTLLGNNEYLSNGSSKDVSFNTTIDVSSSATSVTLGVRYCAWYNSAHTSTYWDVTKNWTVSFDPGTQAPSGLSAQFVSCTDTTVTLDVDVGNYGTPASASGRYVEGAILGSSSYGAPYRYAQASNTSSARLTITNSNSGSLTITPNTEYHYGVYANNTSASSNVVASDTFVTLPAYITNVNAVHTGGGVVNIAVAHAAEGSALTVYTEYSWDGETWTAVSDTFNVTISSRRPIYIRRTSDAGETPTYTLSIAPNNGPQMYGSVSNQAKNLSPVYATFGNYFDNRHVLTGRESYVSTDVLGDQITVTKVSSGSSGYMWVAYPIDATDELINKQVILSGELITSGNFTSGPRLWWLNSANTNILSGPVASIEYIGNSGKFSVTGTIPARPSNAGKLALLLYSNTASAAQGAYTVYNNVELKANVKNIFNYMRSSYPSTKGGVTVSRADDGTFTATGVLSTNYQVWGAYDITDQLEDGVAYTFSQTNNTSGKFYMQMPAHKRDGSGTTYYNIASGTKQTIVVDKTTYDKYTVQIQTGTTSQWGTSSQTITQKFQLEKGKDATAFAPFVDTKTRKLKKVYGSVDGRAKLIYKE